ncbi:hypothetical protein B9Z19DRAFT_1088858 [Tuber borchii]|uniref:Uncharacterized protein n=1 Tax=Tuber borchii TaxID=42251 RepID=A0A2T6ZL15_TUBBO|nr:hypothetical protein B9Z19DRAFT_1088858 [Tuber borchii]
MILKQRWIITVLQSLTVTTAVLGYRMNSNVTTFPLRFRSIPADTTKAELSESLSVSPECVSLARIKWKGDSSTATVTFKKEKLAKSFLKNDVLIGGERLLVDDHFLSLTVLSSHDDDVVEYDLVNQECYRICLCFL